MKARTPGIFPSLDFDKPIKSYRNPVRRFLEWQMSLCERFDRALPERYRIDGNTDFMESILPRRLPTGITVYDVGGGKTPAVSPAQKRSLGLRVVGLDVDAGELARAPSEAYDDVVVADISRHVGAGDADLVICQGVLEHIRDTAGGFRGLGSLLRPGGILLIFVPNRNAPFSLLNRILPEGIKRRLLFWIFPGKKTGSGFPAFYDRCTPRGFRTLADEAGLTLVEQRLYYRSRYFSFFLPLYVLWRGYLLIAERLLKDGAAETFSMVLMRPQQAAAANSRESSPLPPTLQNHTEVEHG